MHNYETDEMIYALATPYYPSALAVMRLSGLGCIERLSTIFRPAKKLRSAPTNSLLHGYIYDNDGKKVDEVVDSTGAGDLYAAGFLYGMSKGRSLGTCAMIGSIAASEIVGHYGARPEVSLRGFVRNKLVQYGKRA